MAVLRIQIRSVRYGEVAVVQNTAGQRHCEIYHHSNKSYVPNTRTM
jgi:hypothetical protein